MFIEGEIPNVVTSTNGCNGNSWTNDFSWIIGLALIGALFGGNGFGFGGNNRGGACATQADLSAGFANSEIMSDLNDILLGQATMQNFINQGFAGLQNSLCSGFAGVNNAVCTLGYQNQAGFNALSTQLASCCCDIKTELMQNRYLNEKQTCDVINASNANTRAILDYLTGEKIASLQAENSGLKAQISNDKQTMNIVSELRNGNCPIPSYLVCDPRVPFNYNQCGCGCN